MNKQKRRNKRAEKNETNTMPPVFTKFATIIFVLLLVATSYLVLSFTPMSKEEHVEKIEQVDQYVEPFRKNISECARQVKANMVDVENFLKRIPQSTLQGKCFVACILKRNSIITKNKINKENLIQANMAVYGHDNEVLDRLKSAITECSKVIENIFEICEYASVFNDCMHMKMEHILDKVTMERRMEALGQMTSDPDVWTDEEDEILKLVKDEL